MNTKKPRLILDSAIAIDPKCGPKAGHESGPLRWLARKTMTKLCAGFDEAVRLGCTDYHLFLQRGSVWSAKGELDKALADYNEAVRRAPSDPLCFYARGHLRFKQRDNDNALRDFNEAIRLAPDFEGCALTPIAGESGS